MFFFQKSFVFQFFFRIFFSKRFFFIRVVSSKKVVCCFFQKMGLFFCQRDFVLKGDRFSVF